MWNLVTAPAWSELIYVTLWRNDGFLHSFCNFSKSNAFGKNFIRTKFILHKIFFQISILSSKKTSRMFFSLCWKNLQKTICGRTWPFWWEGVFGGKNQYKLICKKWGFEYFLYNYLKKKNPKITVKKFFWEARPFFREWGVSKQKWI